MELQGVTVRRDSVFLSIVLACIFFVGLVFVCKTILPGASGVTLTVALDHSDRLQFFYWNGLRKEKFQEKYSVRSKEIPQGEETKVVFSLDNAPVNRVRLDLGEQDGLVKLYQLIVTSHFAKPVILSPPDIYKIFQAGGNDVHVRLMQDYVEVVTEGKDPFLISTEPLNSNLFLLYGLPFIASSLFYLVVNNFDFLSFPAIRDVNEKQPTIGENINTLDGLRAFAAIMVVADHTWGRFTGLGTGGVWIFMSLSGFLLARPFIYQPDKAISATYLSRFFMRRVRRILPIYYCYIVIIYGMNFRFTAAVRHFLFVQGDGHLWVVPQEMLFYLLIPIIMAINSVLFRDRIWIIISGLSLMLIAANGMLGRHYFSLYGMHFNDLRFYLGVFLSGTLFSYLYYGFYQHWESSSLVRKYNVRQLFSCLVVILLLLFLFGSTGRTWGGQRIFAQEYFSWFGIGAGALIFSILAAGKTQVTRFLSCVPLRAISVVSFSLYIFHPLVINFIRKGVMYYSGYSATGLPLFLGTLLVGYVVSCCTYTYIERPFLC